MTSAVQEIERALAQAGVSSSREVTSLLAVQLELVLEENQRMNLTAIRDPDRAVWLHVVDSLLGLGALEYCLPGSLCDIGSGAGYPGIPLALETGRRVTLVESVAKKARFLQHLIEVLGLSGEALPIRAEALARDREGSYSAVTARAVSALPSVLELATPLLKQGGRVICFKGAPEAMEEERGEAAAMLLGLSWVSREEFTLPLPEGPVRRTVIVYARTRVAGVHLPRREGLAQHSPLA